MDIEDIINRKYDFDSEETISVFDELPLWSAPFGMKLLDTVKFKRNINILDIGSGSGFPMLEIAQRFGLGSKVYGIDPWLAAVERIKKKIKIYEISNAEIIIGNAEEMPFKDKFFGLIISNNGLNNIDNPEKALAECYRTAIEGAQLVFTMNLPETMIEFYEVFKKTLIDFNLNGLVKNLHEHIHKKRKSIKEVTNLVESSGFIVENILTETFSIRYFDGSALFRHYFVRLAFLPRWVDIIPNEKKSVFFKDLEYKLNELSKSLGELNLSIPFVCFDCHK